MTPRKRPLPIGLVPIGILMQSRSNKLVEIVTANDWFVGSSWPPGVLSTSRYHPKYRQSPERFNKELPGNSGRMFKTREEMNEYCLSRGYLQRYVDQKISTFKTINRKGLRHAQRRMARWALNMTTYKELYDLSQDYRDFVRTLGLDALESLRFSNGIMIMFRHLRPELFKK